MVLVAAVQLFFVFTVDGELLITHAFAAAVTTES